MFNRKLNCCCDSRSYCVRRTVYWQTVKGVSVTSLRTVGTHDPIQRVEFMNASKLYLFKRDNGAWQFISSRSQWIGLTERNITSARSVSQRLSQNNIRVCIFFDSFFSVRFVTKRYTLQQVSEGINRNLSARNTLAGTTFSPVYRPWEPQCAALQIDRRTDKHADGRHDDANSRSYCVAAVSYTHLTLPTKRIV